MSRAQTVRQAARRAALLGGAAGYLVRGRDSALWRRQRGGVAVLLLHNTIGQDADALISYVERHRDRFTDFDAVETLDTSADRPRVALSFDDGFRSNVGVARRLHHLGLQACFYVPTDVVGQKQAAVDAFFGRPQREGVVAWSDLEELTSLGHIVGSHCREHRPLTGQSDAEGEDQVKGSLEELRRRLGRADHFAWPFGSLEHADATKVVQWCAEAGARAASGVRGFNTTERLEREGYLRRDAINLKWIGVDVAAFLGQDSAHSA